MNAREQGPHHAQECCVAAVSHSEITHHGCLELPTKTKVENTSQSKSGTSLNSSNSGFHHANNLHQIGSGAPPCRRLLQGFPRSASRLNIAHIRQSRPDSGRGVQTQCLQPFTVFPLGSAAGHVKLAGIVAPIEAVFRRNSEEGTSACVQGCVSVCERG